MTKELTAYVVGALVVVVHRGPRHHSLGSTALRS